MAKISTLSKLAGSMPVLADQAARRQQAGQNVQLQQAIAAAPARAPSSPQTAQELGAASAAGAGQIANQQAAALRSQSDQTAQLGLQSTALTNTQRSNEQANRLRSSSIENEARLADLSADAKKELVDSRRSFRDNQAQQKFLQQEQLRDFAMSKAIDAETWKDYAQQAEQAHSRKIQMMETAYKQLSQGIEQGYLKEKGDLDSAARKELIQRKRAIEAAIRREENRKKNNMAAWSAGGAIVGGVIGAVVGTFVAPGVGTAAGASAGATYGQAAGTSIGSANT